MTSDKLDIYDTPNKQYVREGHWVPCFKKVNAEFVTWKIRKRNLRYLCFPGKNFLFIRYLLKENLINRNTYVVAIEEDPERMVQIRLHLPQLLNRKNLFFYEDLFEKLVIDEEFCQKFPFDVAELDFPKFVLKTTRSTPTPPILEALENFFINQQRVINMNLVRINKFYLIITSNMRVIANYDELNRYGGNKTKYLIQEVLRENNDYLNYPYLNQLINKSKFTWEERDLIVIIGINLTIINLASNYFNTILIDKPICYKGRKKGAKMVGLIYLCEKKNIKVGASAKYQKLKIENLKKSIDLSKNTIFLPEPES